MHWCLWASPSQWASLALPKDRLDSFTEWYVFVVMLLSGGIYFFPSVWLALLSTWFSAGTVIVMLHIVLLQRVFGSRAAFEAALGKLGLVKRNDPPTMAVAKLIIELAKEGERDPERLCALALKQLSK